MKTVLKLNIFWIIIILSVTIFLAFYLISNKVGAIVSIISILYLIYFSISISKLKNYEKNT